MLKDKEITEIRKMLLRLSKYGERLDLMSVHTEKAERTCILSARLAIGDAFENLSWVVEAQGEQNEMDI